MSMNTPSLTNVLFSKIQQQLLGLLYGQPDRDFYTNEIIRFCNVGTGAVQRELARLTGAGLILVKQVGNQKRYQANTAMPFFSELRSIVIKTFGLANTLKAALEPLSNQIDVAFIYGSIAKQEDTASSDIDVMVITNDLSYSDFFKLISPAENKLHRKINPTIYSNNEWSRKVEEENHFVIQIISQPKIFLIGTEDDLKTPS